MTAAGDEESVMNASNPGVPRAERLVPAVVSDDTGPGLVEAPLRARNWIGFAGSWFLLAAGTVALFAGSLEIMGVGGFCAEGGPYEIAVHCPTGSGAGITLGMFAVAAGVILGVFGAQGFGTPAHGFFWSLLFGVEGIAFVIAAILLADGISIAWLICGVLFLALAVPPLLMARMGWPRSVFGRRRLDGRSLAKHGLPVRDAAVIGAVWVAAGAAGAGSVLVLLAGLAGLPDPPR